MTEIKSYKIIFSFFTFLIHANSLSAMEQESTPFNHADIASQIICVMKLHDRLSLRQTCTKNFKGVNSAYDTLNNQDGVKPEWDKGLVSYVWDTQKNKWIGTPINGTLRYFLSRNVCTYIWLLYRNEFVCGSNWHESLMSTLEAQDFKSCKDHIPKIRDILQPKKMGISTCISIEYDTAFQHIYWNARDIAETTHSNPDDLKHLCRGNKKLEKLGYQIARIKFLRGKNLPYTHNLWQKLYQIDPNLTVEELIQLDKAGHPLSRSEETKKYDAEMFEKTRHFLEQPYHDMDQFKIAIAPFLMSHGHRLFIGRSAYQHYLSHSCFQISEEFYLKLTPKDKLSDFYKLKNNSRDEFYLTYSSK